MVFKALALTKILLFNSLYTFIQHFINDTIFHRFFSIHPVIAVKILHHLFKCLAAIIGKDFCAQCP